MKEDKETTKSIIPLHGGYKNLITYQKSEVLYDGTISFTKSFFKNMTEPLTKWCRLQEAGNKISLEKAFMQEGGLRERMAKARIETRNNIKK